MIWVSSGILCPIRLVDSGIEVLLTRRAFFNKEKERPMRHPGELVFPGGKYENGDGRVSTLWDYDGPATLKKLQETALREMSEETGYQGPIENVQPLRVGFRRDDGKKFYNRFFTAKIDGKFSRSFTPNGEVLSLHWMSPKKALEYIFSEKFEENQRENFRFLELDNPKFGEYSVTGRQIPTQHIAALQLLYLFQECLKEEYSK